MAIRHVGRVRRFREGAPSFDMEKWSVMFDEIEELDAFDATKLLISETVHSEELETVDGAVSFRVRQDQDGQHSLHVAHSSLQESVDGTLSISQAEFEEFHRAYCRAAQVIRQDESHIWEVRKTYPNAFHRWTEKEHQQLLELHANQTSMEEIVRQMGRSPNGIIAQLEILGVDASSLRTPETPKVVAQPKSKRPRTQTPRTKSKIEPTLQSDAVQRPPQDFEDEFGGF